MSLNPAKAAAMMKPFQTVYMTSQCERMTILTSYLVKQQDQLDEVMEEGFSHGDSVRIARFEDAWKLTFRRDTNGGCPDISWGP